MCLQKMDVFQKPLFHFLMFLCLQEGIRTPITVRSWSAPDLMVSLLRPNCSEPYPTL